MSREAEFLEAVKRGDTVGRSHGTHRTAQLNLLHSLNFTYDSLIRFNSLEQKR